MLILVRASKLTELVEGPTAPMPRIYWNLVCVGKGKRRKCFFFVVVEGKMLRDWSFK